MSYILVLFRPVHGVKESVPAADADLKILVLLRLSLSSPKGPGVEDIEVNRVTAPDAPHFKQGAHGVKPLLAADGRGMQADIKWEVAAEKLTVQLGLGENCSGGAPRTRALGGRGVL